MHAAAVTAAMASAILFSAKGVLMKLAFAQGASIWLFMALRMAYALPLFAWLWLRAARRAKLDGKPDLTRNDWLLIAALGLIGYYLSGVLDIAGLQFVSASMERLILYTHPSLVLLFGWLFLGRRLGWPLMVAMLLGYGGLWLAFGEEAKLSHGQHAALGSFLVFGSAVLYAVFLLLSGRHVKRLGPERMFIAGMGLCTVAVFVQAAVMVPRQEWFASSEVHVLAMVVAVLGTVLPTVLLGIAMHRLGPERTAVLGMVGPVFTLFFGYYALHEPLTWRNAGGLMLTLVGGGILAREGKGAMARKAGSKQDKAVA
jgi:drug/metabolite transporter (DMT)-like permease